MVIYLGAGWGSVVSRPTVIDKVGRDRFNKDRIVSLLRLILSMYFLLV